MAVFARLPLFSQHRRSDCQRKAVAKFFRDSARGKSPCFLKYLLDMTPVAFLS